MAVPPAPNLGTPLAEFRTSWYAVSFLLGVFIVMVMAGFWIVATMSDKITGLFLIVGSGGYIVWQSVGLIRYHYRRRVLLYEEGLVDIRDTTVTTIRWTDVAATQMMPSRWEHPWLRLRLFDGREHMLRAAIDPFKPPRASDTMPTIRMADLLMAVIELTGRHHFVRMVAEYNAGRRVDFGGFQISRTGIHVGNTMLDWEHVDDIDVFDKQVLIARKGVKGVWNSFRYEDVVNQHMLVSLLSHAQGERFRIVTAPGQGRMARARYRRNRILSTVFLCGMIAAPFLFIGGWFVWDYHDWSTNAERHVTSGFCCLDRDPPRALESFEQALRIDPTHVRAVCGRGAALRRLERYDESRRDLETCRQRAGDVSLQQFVRDELAALP